MIHEDLSEEIIGAPVAVLNTLKPGLDEKLQIRQTRLEACRALNNSCSPFSSSVPSVVSVFPFLLSSAVSQ